MPSFDLRQFEQLSKQLPLLVTALFAVIAVVTAIVSSVAPSDESSSSSSTEQAPAPAAPVQLPENLRPNEYVEWNSYVRDAEGNLAVNDEGKNYRFSLYDDRAAADFRQTGVTLNDVNYPASFVGDINAAVTFGWFTQGHTKMRATIGFADSLSSDHAAALGRVGITRNGKVEQVKEIRRGEVAQVEFDTFGMDRVTIQFYAEDANGNRINPTGLTLGTPEFGYFE